MERGPGHDYARAHRRAGRGEAARRRRQAHPHGELPLRQDAGRLRLVVPTQRAAPRLVPSNSPRCSSSSAATTWCWWGSPGVGEAHLSVAIGYEAVMARKQVYFADCSRLVEDLGARRQGRPPLAGWSSTSTAACDEVDELATSTSKGGRRPAVPAGQQALPR